MPTHQPFTWVRSPIRAEAAQDEFWFLKNYPWVLNRVPAGYLLIYVNCAADGTFTIQYEKKPKKGVPADRYTEIKVKAP